MAVSSNCVVTTRHQGGDTSVPVMIAGREYEIDQIWNHPTADLRVVKLKNANLSDFVELFTDSNEINREIVIAGYGKMRGEVLENYGTVYGYRWTTYSTSTVRMGTNKVKDYDYDIPTLSYISDVIYADFDGLGEGDSTTYEATQVSLDSGGGWFIKSEGQWKLAGLCLRTQVHYAEGHEDDPAYRESWFRNRSNPGQLLPDYLDAARISCYHEWITRTIPEVTDGDFNGDDYVDFTDFAVLAGFWMDTDCHGPDWCLGVDYEPDGDVDWDDLAFFVDNWLMGY